MENTEFDRLAEIFKALSHPIRLQIVFGLVEKKECNVTKMVEKLNMPQPNVSQHINILKNAGIIDGYRKGNQICYRVKDDIAEKIVKCFKAE